MMIKMISDETDNDNDVNGTVVQDSGASSGRVTTRQYVPGVAPTNVTTPTSVTNAHKCNTPSPTNVTTFFS